MLRISIAQPNTRAAGGTRRVISSVPSGRSRRSIGEISTGLACDQGANPHPNSAG
ncbi:MAG: hypothetical protein JJU31_13815 [Wenzhouxiangella sp.]|nr:hypothetical protein [Wenzhouxiangella sp.]